MAPSGAIIQEAGRRRSSVEAEPLESEEEFVTVRPIEGVNNDTYREVRISCPDATGLGCDVARMLFDFGLRVVEGDVSTDGKWCFLIFKVRFLQPIIKSGTINCFDIKGGNLAKPNNSVESAVLECTRPRKLPIIQVKLSRDVRAHWTLLKHRLKKICPMGGGNVPLWTTRPAAEDYGQPFLLSVSSYDRKGFLHDLMHTLWEADVVVFKAHITTSPGGRVLDMFWIHDHRLELPETHRVLQIKEMVKECLHQKEVEFKIEPAPPGTSNDVSASVLVKRCACVDASAFSPLRRLLYKRRKDKDNGGVVITTQTDEFGTPEHIQVGIDNCTSAAYSVVSVLCSDRKGLVYDLMRTMKDTHVHVAYAKVNVRHGGLCEVELFVREVDGNRITDADLQEELIDRVRHAVTLPMRIDIKDVFDGTCTELLVTAFLDSGGRGRPRVTYDVTAALSSLGLCVFMADVYIDVLKNDVNRPVELHRFLIHRPDGKWLQSAAEKKLVYTRVQAQLMGTDEVLQESKSPSETPQESAAKLVLDSLFSWNWKG